MSRSSPAAGRWRRRKEARPGEILAAAAETFAERGFAAARIEEIAARAGVSKGTVYLYFKSKQDIFEALVRQALLPNVQRFEALVDRYPGPTPQLLGLLAERLGAMLRDPAISVIPKLILAEAGNFPDMAKFYLDEIVHRGLGLVARTVQRGIDRGEFRPVDPMMVARLFITPVLFSVIWTTTFERHEAEPLDRSSLFRHHLDILLRGLRADAATEPAP